MFHIIILLKKTWQAKLIGILSKMGINVPARVSKEAITRVVEELPRLTPSQIDKFYKEAKKIGSN